MPHTIEHAGSAREDATTYGMPRRERASRLQQQNALYDNKSLKAQKIELQVN